MYVLALALDLFQELKCVFLLTTLTEELISTPKIITLLSNPPPGNEKLSLLLKPIP